MARNASKTKRNKKQKKTTRTLKRKGGAQKRYRKGDIDKRASYDGDLNKNGEPDGVGRMIYVHDVNLNKDGVMIYDERYDNFDSYYGTWKNGKREGYGEMAYHNYNDSEILDLYQGKWKDDKKEGNGRMVSYTKYYETLPETIIYQGEWKDDLKNGIGKYMLQNGDYYETTWEDGQPDSEGNLRMTIETGDIYEGEVHNYEGQWKPELPNGKGKMIYADGTVYDGEWVNGEPYTIELNISISNTKYAECLGKTAFEQIEGEVNVGVFIKDEGNLVFKLGDSFYGIKKEQIIPIYKNSGETVYCCKNVDTSIVPRRENVDIDNPYFNMNKIGIISGIVKRDYIKKILDDDKNKLYELVRTEQKCTASTTGQMLGNNPTAVSADHCQARSDKVIYEIQIIKQETIGGEKYKKSSRKNKTKKKRYL